MQATDTATVRYVRTEDTAEVYNTDERGPGIAPVDVIYRSTWRHAATGEPVTDQTELERLERDYPPQQKAG